MQLLSILFIIIIQNNEKTSVLQVTAFLPLEGMMDWIGSGPYESEHRHSSWIELDCVSKFVDWVGLDLTK